MMGGGIFFGVSKNIPHPTVAIRLFQSAKQLPFFKSPLVFGGNKGLQACLF